MVCTVQRYQWLSSIALNLQMLPVMSLVCFRVMASTQFEATHARQAFPCFDEPAFKANFTIRVRREPRHIALSNMPKVGQWCPASYHQQCLHIITWLERRLDQHRFFTAQDSGAARRSPGWLLWHQRENEHLPGGLHRMRFPLHSKDHRAWRWSMQAVSFCLF